MANSSYSVVWSVINPYTTKNISNGAPNKDGVYLLCTNQASGAYRVRYVGQGNIRKRLSDHLSANEKNLQLKEHISKYHMKVFYAEIGRQNDRDDVELFLYETFQPRYNQIKPPSNTPLKVNLPIF